MRDRKARRLTSLPGLGVLAVAGALAVAGLAGCRADPSVAAYVDDVEITEAEIDGVMADLQGPLAAEVAGLSGTEEERADQLDQRISSVRLEVLQMRILTEAGTSFAEEHGVELPAPDLGAQAERLRMDTDQPVVALAAEYAVVRDALEQTVQPAAPSEADQREVYENLVSQGLEPPPFEEVQDQLNEDLLGRTVGLRDVWQAALGQAEVQVNPQYQLVHRVPVQIGSVQSWLGVPVGAESAVVESG